jgi:hypothetical protein
VALTPHAKIDVEALSQVFDFERDFADTLRCIPMAVRFKLDLSGVKLSLEQWGVFTLDDREQLLLRACDTPEQVRVYRQLLASLVQTRAGQVAQDLRLPDYRAWDDTSQVPAQIRSFAHARDLPELGLEQWQALDPFQRYVLLKLSRPSHDNVNFVPALREFGLLSRDEQKHDAD